MKPETRIGLVFFVIALVVIGALVIGDLISDDVLVKIDTDDRENVFFAKRYSSDYGGLYHYSPLPMEFDVDRWHRNVQYYFGERTYMDDGTINVKILGPYFLILDRGLNKTIQLEQHNVTIGVI